jgi:hypothetical protein
MSSPQEIADNLGTLGISKAVLPIPLLPDDWKPGPDMRASLIRASRRAASTCGSAWAPVERTRRRASAARDRAGLSQPQYGIPPGEGHDGLGRAAQELDPKLVFLELDLGWVTAGGLDPVAELRRLKGRVKMVHLKDVKPTTKTNYALQQDPCEVGLGKLNWHAILPACAAAGVQHYFVEQEPPFAHDRFDSVKMSYDFLSRFKA